jgi:predicted transcriptional regulator
MTTETQTAPSNTASVADHASRIVAAYVGNNTLPSAELPALISSVHQALVSAISPAVAVTPSTPAEPAVSVKKSITNDFLICLDDGRKLKSLKRHLAKLGMTPDEYRAKWGLPADYPMVAPAYAKARSELAKQMGLGQGGRQVSRKAKTETAAA